MQVVRSENIVCVDVDDTLVLWDNTHKRTLSMFEPVLGEMIKIAPHWPNIRLLKEKSLRGATVVVWSQGGYKYAEAIVRVLKLEAYVDYVMSKPSVVIDDLPVDMWMPRSFTLNPDKVYKK